MLGADGGDSVEEHSADGESHHRGVHEAARAGVCRQREGEGLLHEVELSADDAPRGGGAGVQANGFESGGSGGE